jgi:hypothetical protein
MVGDRGRRRLVARIFAPDGSRGRTRTYAGRGDRDYEVSLPWTGALHSLLDDVADHVEDDATEQRNFLDYSSSLRRPPND